MVAAPPTLGRRGTPETNTAGAKSQVSSRNLAYTGASADTVAVLQTS